MISIAIDLLKRYLPQIIGVIALIGLYFYWHHSIYQDGRKDEKAVWELREANTQRQINDLLKLKQHEADLINKETQERLTNAAKIYAQHYDDLRINPVVERVFVSTKANCGGNSMPGTNQSGPGFTQGSTGINKAELPESNLRQLNRVISKIELMQLKCEYLLNQSE